MTQANSDAAEALSHPSAHDPFLQGQSAFWSRQRAWDTDLSTGGMTMAQREHWRRGYAAAQDAAVCSAAAETQTFMRTWINALYDAGRILTRINNEAPPKSPGLRMALRSSLTRVNTALAYVPAGMQAQAGDDAS